MHRFFFVFRFMPPYPCERMKERCLSKMLLHPSRDTTHISRIVPLRTFCIGATHQVGLVNDTSVGGKQVSKVHRTLGSVMMMRRVELHGNRRTAAARFFLKTLLPRTMSNGCSSGGISVSY